MRHIMSWLRGDYLSNRQVEQKIWWWKGWLIGWSCGLLFVTFGLGMRPSKACAHTVETDKHLIAQTRGKS